MKTQSLLQNPRLLWSLLAALAILLPGIALAEDEGLFGHPATTFWWVPTSASEKYWSDVGCWTSDATGHYVDPTYGPVGPIDTDNPELIVIFDSGHDFGVTVVNEYCILGKLDINSSVVFQIGKNAQTNSGDLEFYGAGIMVGSSSASAIQILDGGQIGFHNSASAGVATFDLTGSNNCNIRFYDSSTSGSATFNLIGANSYVQFDSSSKADAATFNLTGSNSYVTFNGLTNESLETQATFHLTGHESAVFLTGTSTAWNASFIFDAVDHSSYLDISQLDADVNTTSIGSVEGNGTVYLGSKTLFIESSKNTTFAGRFTDGGTGGGTGGRLIKDETGTLTLTGSSDYTGGTQIWGGAIQLGDSTSVNGYITGDIINNATLIFANAHTQTFAGVISGTGVVEKSGGLLLLLTGANTYSGGTFIHDGAIKVESSQALGSGSITLDGSFAALEFTKSAAAIAPAITVTGGNVWFRDSSTSGSTTIHVSNDNNNVVFTGSSTAGTSVITIDNKGGILFMEEASADNATFQVYDATVQFSGSSSAGHATFNAYGEITFDSNATAANATINLHDVAYFQGGASAGNATINLSASSWITFSDFTSAENATINLTGEDTSIAFQIYANGGNASFALLNSTSSLDFSDQSTGAVSAGSLEGSGTVYLGRNNFTVGSNGQSKRFSGTISDGGLAGGSGASITKTGAGTWTLAGKNTYTGSTRVSQGTLSVTGTLASTSGVTVDAGSTLEVGHNGVINQAAPVALSGTLRGEGSVGAVTATGGVIAPGNSGAHLTISQLDMDGASSIQFTLGDNKTEYDAIWTGSLTLSLGAALVVSDPHNVGSTFVWGDSLQLFRDLNGNATVFASGTFATIAAPTLKAGLSWSTADLYTKGQLKVVPEASTNALLVAGTALIVSLRRKKRNRAAA